MENAVIHGIQPCPEGGTITISSKSAHGGSVLSVQDDGVGLMEGSFCEDDEDQASKSVGLANVRQRLLNLYGPSAELQLSCDGEKGVTARIFIPGGEMS